MIDFKVMDNPTLEEFKDKLKYIPSNFVYVTHDGIFHAHEVFDLALLTKKYDIGLVVRSKNNDIIDYAKEVGCFINDVGLTNKGNTIKDHHEKSISKKIKSLTNSPQDEELLLDYMFLCYHDIINRCENHYLKDSIRKLLLSVAKIDNNISYINYISTDISNFNPCWNEENTDMSEYFINAVDYADSCLCMAKSIIDRVERNNKRQQAKVEGMKYVRTLINTQRMVKEILTLPTFVPWQETISIYNNSEEGKNNNIVFVIFPDIVDENIWKVQAVENNKVNIKNLLPKDKMIGCTFCHPSNRYIASFDSYDHAYNGAIDSLIYKENEKE